MSQNTNNSNTGGAGIGHDRGAMAGIVPTKVIVEDPGEGPSQQKLPGGTFEPGEPQGDGVHPSPHADGFSYGDG